MNIRKLFCPDNTPRILLFLFFFVISVITTIACGYTEKNATGNVLLLFLLLLLAHRNTLTSITALLFLFCCALYAPAGMTYGKINNSFIVALLQTTADEAAEFTGMIPVYHFLVSAAILVFMVIFWRTHHRGHRNWLALLLFVLCSVNSWPLRMVKGTVVGTTDTLREMQRYEQLSQHRADSWKILPGAPLYDTIVIVTGESVRRDYMSVYGYSVPLIITASDITSHQSVSRKISARHFAGIFQWLTGIRTENIPPFNPLTDEDNEPVMVFNGERNVPADSLKPQPLILPVRGK
ncbi:DUF1705 domain-containing protein [Escherichia coli]|nr:DUF1705 domain-containing protein [Escherichia coli]